MVSPSSGRVVLVTFPFSDLTEAKLRPAVVLAAANQRDWILCQVTSNPYSDSKAVQIESTDFESGSLHRISYARPGKLFTANTSLFKGEAGKLKPEKLTFLIEKVVEVIKGNN